MVTAMASGRSIPEASRLAASSARWPPGGRGGDFGYDSAEPGMLIDAGGDLVGEQLGGAVGPPDDTDSCFIAGTFDSQDDHRGSSSGRRVSVRARRIMVYASAPDG